MLRCQVVAAHVNYDDLDDAVISKLVPVLSAAEDHLHGFYQAAGQALYLLGIPRKLFVPAP